MKTKRLVLLFVLVALLAGLGIGAMTASARTTNIITVNSTDGTYNPGDGKCTLREAINNANSDSATLPGSSDCVAGSGADVIELGTGLTYTLNQIDSGSGSNVNALPVITSEITINGHGSIIERGPAFYMRIIHINFSGNLTLNDVTLRNGYLYAPTQLLVGGGIWNEGTLKINQSVLASNSANEGGGIWNDGSAVLKNTSLNENSARNYVDEDYTQYGIGGGILNYSNGHLELDQVTLHGNTTEGTTGGAGGGLLSYGLFTISDSTFSNNYSPYGGAILADASAAMDVPITNTTFSGNTAKEGGAIYLHGYSKPTHMTIVGSTFDHNEASDWGGALNGTTLNATYTVVNSTFAYNEARKGSAMYLKSGGVAYVTNSTIRFNSSTADYLFGGSVHAYAGSFFMENTVVSYAFGGPNCYIEAGGTLFNTGNNVDDGASCGWGSNNGSQSLATLNFGPLQYNGGNTQTMLPLAGSDTIDHGNDVTCAAAPINNRDQRGYLRPIGAHCDVGAVEAGSGLPTATPSPTATATNTPLPPPTNTPTVTPTTDPGCATAPAAPTLLKPKKNKSVNKLKVKLDWSDTLCTTTYRVEVRSGSKVGPIADSATGLTSSLFKTKKLDPASTYFWRAGACNTHGCTDSDWRKFTTK